MDFDYSTIPNSPIIWGLVHFISNFCTLFTVYVVLNFLNSSICVYVDCATLLYSLRVHICTVLCSRVLNCTMPVILVIYKLYCTIPVKSDKYLEINIYKYMYCSFVYLLLFSYKRYQTFQIIPPFVLPLYIGIHVFLVKPHCVVISENLLLLHVFHYSYKASIVSFTMHRLFSRASLKSQSIYSTTLCFYRGSSFKIIIYVIMLIYSCLYTFAYMCTNISSYLYMFYSFPFILNQFHFYSPHLNHKYASSAVFVICQYGYNPPHVRFTIYRLFSSSLNIRFKFTLISSAVYLININCQLAFGAWTQPSFLYKRLYVLSSSNSPCVVFSVDCFISSRFLFLLSAWVYFDIFNTKHPLMIAQPFIIVHDIFSLCIVWSPLVLKISNVLNVGLSFCKVIYSNLPDNLSYK